jgi:N6-adenosine-specific RNA methylase IME4
MASKKFDLIVCDAPWAFSDKLEQSEIARGAAANYSTMTISEIKQMRVKEISSDGAVLALWVPSSLLQEGLDVMKEWGFKHKQTYIWVKNKKNPFFASFKLAFKNIKNNFKNNKFDITDLNNVISDLSNSLNLNDSLAFGMGRLFRQTHEICLIGTNSNKIYKTLANKSQRSVSFGVNLRHSAKPDNLQDSLEIMFPDAEKIEIFARRVKPGWTSIGNEVCDGEDINVSIKKLIDS